MRKTLTALIICLPLIIVLWCFRKFFTMIAVIFAILNLSPVPIARLSLDVGAAGLWFMILCGEGRKEADRVIEELRKQYAEAEGRFAQGSK